MCSISSPSVFFFPLFFRSEFVLSVETKAEGDTVGERAPGLVVAATTGSYELEHVFSSGGGVVADTPVIIGITTGVSEVTFQLYQFQVYSIVAVILSVAELDRVIAPTGRWDYVSDPSEWWEVATVLELVRELVVVDGECFVSHIVDGAGVDEVEAIDPMQAWVLFDSS